LKGEWVNSGGLRRGAGDYVSNNREVGNRRNADGWIVLEKGERQPLIAAIDGHKKVPLRVGKLLTLIAALEKAA
jgi:hypothetical protein